MPNMTGYIILVSTSETQWNWIQSYLSRSPEFSNLQVFFELTTNSQVLSSLYSTSFSILLTCAEESHTPLRPPLKRQFPSFPHLILPSHL